MIRRLVISVAGLCVALSSCKKDGGGESKGEPAADGATDGAADAATDSGTDTDTGIITGNLAITTPDQALVVVKEALLSTAGLSTDLSAPKAGALAIATLNLGDGEPKTDAYDGEVDGCIQGTPVNPDDPVFAGEATGSVNEVNERAPYYASGKWYCIIKHTIPDAFEMVAGVVCAVGELKYDGTEKDLERDAKIDTKCFSQSFVDQAKNEGMGDVKVKVTATAKDGTAAEEFDKHLRLEFTAGAGDGGPQTFDVWFAITDKSIAFANVPGGEDHLSAKAARLDLETGVLRYESYEDRWVAGALDDKSQFSHTRVLIKGEFDKSGKAKNLTEMQGAVTESYYHEGNEQQAANHSTRIVTMKGNLSDGVRTHAVNGGGEADAIQPVDYLKNLDECEWPDGIQGECVEVTERNACFGTGKPTCEGNDGIKPKAVGDFVFYNYPTAGFADSPGYVAPPDWVKSKAAYLSFDAVDLTQ